MILGELKKKKNIFSRCAFGFYQKIFLLILIHSFIQLNPQRHKVRSGYIPTVLRQLTLSTALQVTSRVIKPWIKAKWLLYYSLEI